MIALKILLCVRNQTLMGIKKSTTPLDDLPDLDDLPPTQVCTFSKPVEDRIPEIFNLATEKSTRKSHLQTSYSKTCKDHKQGSKRLLGCQNKMKEFEEVESSSNNLSSKKLKQDIDECSNKKISQPDFKLNIKKEKMDPSESKEERGTCEKVDTVKIKQEKMEFEFLKPDIQMFDMSKSVSVASNTIKIKTEDPFEDSLPPTQAVNLDSFDDDSLPATQAVNFNNNSLPSTHPVALHQTEINSRIVTTFNRKDDLGAKNCNLLSSSQIKKEICHDADDDVTILECVAISDTKPKDEIVIDDDDDDSKDTASCVVAKVHVSTSKHENRVDVSKSVSAKSRANSKTSNTIQKEADKNLEQDLSNQEHKQKCHNSSVKLKHCKSDKEKFVEKKDKAKNLKCNPSASEKEKNTKEKYGSSKSDSRTSNSYSKHIEKSKDPLLEKRDKAHQSNSKKLENSSTKCKKSDLKHEGSRDLAEGKKKGNISLDTKCIKGDSKRSYSKELPREKNKDNVNLELKYIKGDLKLKHSKDLPFEKHNKKTNLESQLIKDESKHSHAKSLSKEKNKEKLSFAEKSSKNDSKQRDSNELFVKKVKETVSIGSKRTKSDPKQNHFPDLIVKKDREKKLNALQKSSVSSEVKKISKAIKSNISEPMLVEENSKDSIKDKQSSSEKENSKLSNKDRYGKNEIFITLKPISKKRPHTNVDGENEIKKRKYNHSVDSESCSSDEVSSLKSDTSMGMNFTKVNSGCGFMSDDMSTPCSDQGMENVNVLNTKSRNESSYPFMDTNSKKISCKNDLKEEIENEVKLVLKPFFTTGLITKDDYKDIMRRAVPKILKNCHSSINPEKISKLILSYISLLGKS